MAGHLLFLQRTDDWKMSCIHGSAASRTLRTLTGKVEVCVAVTLIDGLVLARSAFHHSMNTDQW
jgi:nitroimidazol reductase NimA-like FMN-containing flavoprotein (pyridoxamine 5'-phosphate oxidase superfamily)